MVRRVRKRRSWSDPDFALIRDALLFFGGLVGVFYETVFVKVDRPTLLLLFAAMLGIPAFLNANENRQADEKLIDKAVEGQTKSITSGRHRPVPDVEDEDDRDRAAELRAELEEIAERRRRRERGTGKRYHDEDFDLEDLDDRPDGRGPDRRRIQ